MKKWVSFSLAVLMIFGLSAVAQAKVLKVALDAGPVSQDPQVQLSGGMLQYSHWTFDPLVRYRQDMSFEPRLAEKWERIDDLTMRFYLRKGVKFHSGNPFTAADVKFTFDAPLLRVHSMCSISTSLKSANSVSSSVRV